MLYPLSYEGLACTFAQHAGQVSFRWAWAGYLASDEIEPAGQLGRLRPMVPSRVAIGGQAGEQAGTGGAQGPASDHG
jgi:hypothetical protein